MRERYPPKGFLTHGSKVFLLGISILVVLTSGCKPEPPTTAFYLVFNNESGKGIEVIEAERGRELKINPRKRESIKGYYDDAVIELPKSIDIGWRTADVISLEQSCGGYGVRPDGTYGAMSACCMDGRRCSWNPLQSNYRTERIDLTPLLESKLYNRARTPITSWLHGYGGARFSVVLRFYDGKDNLSISYEESYKRRAGWYSVIFLLVGLMLTPITWILASGNQAVRQSAWAYFPISWAVISVLLAHLSESGAFGFFGLYAAGAGYVISQFPGLGHTSEPLMWLTGSATFAFLLLILLISLWPENKDKDDYKEAISRVGEIGDEKREIEAEVDRKDSHSTREKDGDS